MTLTGKLKLCCSAYLESFGLPSAKLWIVFYYLQFSNVSRSQFFSTNRTIVIIAIIIIIIITGFHFLAKLASLELAIFLPQPSKY